MNRHLTAALFFLALSPAHGADDGSAQMSPAQQEKTAHAHQVVMHKAPGCGCCAIWAEHMQAHGFAVESISDPDVQALKGRLAIPTAARSCHTAMVDRYLIEGHVPASDIIRLLKEKPDDVKGLSVPGMPLGSPGMEHPRPQPYQTVALMKDGTMQVYAEHEPGEDYSPRADEEDQSD